MHKKKDFAYLIKEKQTDKTHASFEPTVILNPIHVALNRTGKYVAFESLAI